MAVRLKSFLGLPDLAAQRSRPYACLVFFDAAQTVKAEGNAIKRLQVCLMMWKPGLATYCHQKVACLEGHLLLAKTPRIYPRMARVNLQLIQRHVLGSE